MAKYEIIIIVKKIYYRFIQLFIYTEYIHWITNIGCFTLSRTYVVVYNFYNNNDILEKDSIYLTLEEIYEIRGGTDGS